MVPGCAGTVVPVTGSVLGGLAPQALLAVTEIIPLPAPTVAVIELEVELPLHPEGSAHVYEVIPLTAVTL